MWWDILKDLAKYLLLSVLVKIFENWLAFDKDSGKNSGSIFSGHQIVGLLIACV